MKRTTGLLILIFAMSFTLILGGCQAEVKLKEEFNKDEFYAGGFEILTKCNSNIQLKEYKIDLNDGWLDEYKEYKLDDTQQTYYDLILQIAKLNNKFKETNKDEHLDKMISKVTDLNKFLDTNGKEIKDSIQKDK